MILCVHKKSIRHYLNGGYQENNIFNSLDYHKIITAFL